MKYEFLKAILWAAIEDYNGLWEIPWELNSIDEKYPSALPLNIAKILLKEELINLYYCQEPYGEMTLISSLEVQKVLLDIKYWEAPLEDSISIRFSATEKGEKLYSLSDEDFIKYFSSYIVEWTRIALFSY